jgi:hypothetical protein
MVEPRCESPERKHRPSAGPPPRHLRPRRVTLPDGPVDVPAVASASELQPEEVISAAVRAKTIGAGTVNLHS